MDQQAITAKKIELEALQIATEQMQATNTLHWPFVFHLIETCGRHNGLFHPFVRVWYNSVLDCVDIKTDVEDKLQVLRILAKEI